MGNGTQSGLAAHAVPDNGALLSSCHLTRTSLYSMLLLRNSAVIAVCPQSLCLCVCSQQSLLGQLPMLMLASQLQKR